MRYAADTISGATAAFANDQSNRNLSLERAFGRVLDRQKEGRLTTQRADELEKDRTFRREEGEANRKEYRDAALARSIEDKKFADEKLKDVVQKDAAERLAYYYDNGLPIPDGMVQAAGEAGVAIQSAGEAKRARELEAFKTSKDTALAFNRIATIERQAAELKKAPGQSKIFGEFFGGQPAGNQHPQDQAKILLDRLQPLKLRYAPLFDPKAKLIELDATTGLALPAVKPSPWMQDIFKKALSANQPGLPTRQSIMNRTVPVQFGGRTAFTPQVQAAPPIASAGPSPAGAVRNITPPMSAPTNGMPVININIPAQGGAAAGPVRTSAPSPAAIEHLVSNPQLWEAFDAKYGAGASSQYLP